MQIYSIFFLPVLKVVLWLAPGVVYIYLVLMHMHMHELPSVSIDYSLNVCNLKNVYSSVVYVNCYYSVLCHSDSLSYIQGEASAIPDEKMKEREKKIISHDHEPGVIITAWKPISHEILSSFLPSLRMSQGWLGRMKFTHVNIYRQSAVETILTMDTLKETFTVLRVWIDLRSSTAIWPVCNIKLQFNMSIYV